ncbi:MAG: hypothetical protein OEZ34_04820 [Spirochaetia bacterium]|nr:hypothetical protein [Spirochaetia bacterium]
MIEQRRNFLRFKPESLDIAVAVIDQEKLNNPSYSKQLDGDLAGLILDQSHKGCSIIFINRDDSEYFFLEGSKCILQVGKLPPLMAEVKWREKLPSRIYKVGFEFID